MNPKHSQLLSKLKMQLQVQAQHIKEQGGNVDTELQSVLDSVDLGDYAAARAFLAKAQTGWESSR